MKKDIWNEFIKWGSGFTIEAERDYKEKGEPLYFHLFMYGLYYPDNYELVGKNLDKLMEQAIRDGKRSLRKIKSCSKNKIKIKS